jgi:hypothetical protein
MDSPLSLLFFFLFALVLLGMYLGIRRRWLSPGLIAAIGVLVSIVLMTLFGLSEGNSIYQALLNGFVVGGLFSAAVLAIAVYFMRAEARKSSG